MFRILYSFLGYLLLPFILLRLLWRSRKLPLYRRRIKERFGYFSIPTHFQHGIWIHAVSMGETLLAVPLIKALQNAYPQMPIVVTTMTATGSEQVTKNFAEKVFHVYVPYDLPGFIKRFLKKVQPQLAIFIETELWPNTLHYCRQLEIPTLIANARLSERSMRGYARFSTITCHLLQNVNYVAVQTEEEAKRFIQLGLAKEKCSVTGSIKFDIQLPSNIEEKSRNLREQLGTERPIWIAASTHEGEEEQILSAFAKVKESLKESLLILVPRHPERFNKVAQLCERQDYRIIRRSTGQNCTKDTDIFLGDTMGELLCFYGASDVAFVGGSLIERGGHNLLEPVAMNLPVLSGPHLFNFTKIAELLHNANALIIVNSADELAVNIIKILTDKAYSKRITQAGNQVIDANRGALKYHLNIIDQMLQRKI